LDRCNDQRAAPTTLHGLQCHLGFTRTSRHDNDPRFSFAPGFECLCLFESKRFRIIFAEDDRLPSRNTIDHA
jgi:hypothetical protein